MKEGLAEIVMILDRSGSMSDVWSDAIGAMKTYIRQQQEVAGDALLTMVLFDEPPFDMIYDREDIHLLDLSRLDKFYPRSNTALLKAVSDTVDEVSKNISQRPESQRPERVLVVVMTDGKENASNPYYWGNLKTPNVIFNKPFENQGSTLPYTRAKLKSKLGILRNLYGWKIIFLGADEEAFDEGNQMGMSSSYRYTKSAAGIHTAYAGLNMATASFRTTGLMDDSALKGNS